MYLGTSWLEPCIPSNRFVYAYLEMRNELQIKAYIRKKTLPRCSLHTAIVSAERTAVKT